MATQGTRGLPTSVTRAIAPETLLEKVALSRPAFLMLAATRRLQHGAAERLRRLLLWSAAWLSTLMPRTPRGPVSAWWERLLARVANRMFNVAFQANAVSNPQDIARLVARSDEARGVLLNKPLPTLDADKLLRLQDYSALQPHVRAWIRSNQNARPHIAAVVVTELTLSGPATIGAIGIERCLAVMAEVAGVMSPTQVTQTAKVIVGIASAPVDPYSRVNLQTPARGALLELFAARPELDTTAVPPGTLASGAHERTYLEALGRALHRDTTQRTGRFLRAAANASLDPAALRTFATNASAASRRAPRKQPLTAPLITMGWSAHIGSIVAAVTAPMLGAAVLLYALSRRPPGFLAEVTLEVTLASFALIATVHALIITLSREHVPRRMARRVATPRILLSAYSAAATGIVASAINTTATYTLHRDPALPWATPLNGVAAVAVLSAVALLATSCVQVLRLADPVAVTSRFGRDSALALIRSGSRYGRIQARSLELATLFEALPTVRLSAEPMPGETAESIRARTRGVFSPSNRSLRRLLTSTQFGAGMTLRIHASLGEIAARLDPVLAVVPTSAQSVSRTSRRHARAVAALRPVSWIDRAGGATASLLDLAFRICREGDRGGAQRAASVCLDLAFRHMSAMAHARSLAYMRGRRKVRRRANVAAWRPGGATWQPPHVSSSHETPPTSPVISDVIAACVQKVASEFATEREIALYILRGLLSYGAREDRIPTLISRQVAYARTPSGSSAAYLEVLGRCAVTNLQLGLRGEFSAVLAHMKFSPFDEGSFLSEATTAIAAGVRLDATEAGAQLDGFIGDARHDSHTRAASLYRIGSAALDVGSFSVAVACVAHLSASGFIPRDALWVRSLSIPTRPGSYLGNNPEDALMQFKTFADELAPLFSTPP